MTSLDRHATMPDEPGDWLPVKDAHGRIWCEFSPQSRQIRLKKSGGGAFRRVALITLDNLAAGKLTVTTHTESA